MLYNKHIFILPIYRYIATLCVVILGLPFMFTDSAMSGYGLILARVAIAVALLIMIFHEDFVLSKPRLFTCTFYTLIFISMPCYSMYSLVHYGFSYIWVVNTSIVLITMIILLESKSFIALLALSVSVSYTLMDDNTFSDDGMNSILSAIYLIAFSILISIFVQRRKESHNEMGMDRLKNLLYIAAHDVRGPVGELRRMAHSNNEDKMKNIQDCVNRLYDKLSKTRNIINLRSCIETNNV